MDMGEKRRADEPSARIDGWLERPSSGKMIPGEISRIFVLNLSGKRSDAPTLSANISVADRAFVLIEGICHSIFVVPTLREGAKSAVPHSG
jgi:hypothetical protein